MAKLKTLQNFYKTTISTAWAAGTGNRYVSALPTPTAGYLVVNPSNSSKREIVEYNAIGSDGGGNYVTLITRGVGGTSDIAHDVNEPVRMNYTAELYAAVDTELEDLQTQINDAVIAGAPNASTSVKGISKLSVAPASATDPIAVGDNDVRVPTADPDTLYKLAPGVIFPYAISTAPSGFLSCDGSLYDISTYSELYDALRGDNFLYGVGTGTTFTVDAFTDVITSTGHGLVDDDVVFLRSTTTLPAGLSADTTYYVISATTNTFKLSATQGGSSIDITDAGTGTHSWYTQYKLPDLRSSFPIGKGQRTTVTFDFADADVTVGTDEITVDSNDYLHTGQKVTLSTTGTLPAGLSVGDYYVIRVDDTTIKLATSVANANDGTDVDITAAAGGGTHTMTMTVFTDRVLGSSGGNEGKGSVASHRHVSTQEFKTGPNGGGGAGADRHTDAFVTMNPTGEDSMDIMPPYTVIHYIIKT